MSIKAALSQWWVEKRIQMVTGMKMQMEKYPDTDPRKDALRERIEAMESKIDLSYGKEADDGSDEQ